MKDEIIVQKGLPFPMGLSLCQSGVNVAVAVESLPANECGILLYDIKKHSVKIPFPAFCRIGNIFAACLKLDITKFRYYQFYCDDKIFMDPYAKAIDGRNIWGKLKKEDKPLKALLPTADAFDWGGDQYPETDFADTILYGLHVRGFTRHASSGVSKEKRGTFEGVEEKIPYLKSLGITAIECMPIYEFDEIILNPAYEATEEKNRLYREQGAAVTTTIDNWQYRINYWGFADRGNYFFAPKASYSAYHDPVRSLKRLIRSLHREGIEMIMQIYFPIKCDPCYIQRVIHYWVTEFHVDGFHLIGMKIPRSLLALDPLLARTKLIMEEPDGVRIYSEGRKNPDFRNLASYRDDFRCDARKFLKGDEDMLRSITEHMRRNSRQEAVIHHITDYRGFTLLDLVSYDQKHNEANGENNRDGSEYNYSWNCGVEGVSRKKGISMMRLSQRKNALAFLMLSQGVPFLQAGDEFGRTTGGNNNPYCQDNETNWLIWRPDQWGRQLMDYTKKLIAFRKSHPILHRKDPLQLMDSISCGYPDLSYHGQSAWYAQMENYNRHVGILYCGLYESMPQGKTDDFVYLAINMHWIDHDFALPSLPEGYQWYQICDTKQIGEEDNLGGFNGQGCLLETLLKEKEQPKAEKKSAAKPAPDTGKSV
ncbi:MAG: alpha-amylase, partial [Lachnospiraceae bacterium]|nr:alpha-amylase [Lachnospiraceae bacterium]